MGLLDGEVAGEPEIRDPDVAVLVEQDVGGLEVPVDHVPDVHVLQPQDDLGGVETHLVL